MPDKPIWFKRLDAALEQLDAFPSPWIDRAAIESVLGIGRRRAQQILRPLVQRTIGRNGLAPKESVIVYLRQLARGDAAVFERQRRERLVALIDTWHAEAKHQPQILVEAPETIVNQELAELPPGIHLSPGRIVIEDFSTPDQAKRKLLALILAIGNDPDGFDLRVSREYGA